MPDQSDFANASPASLTASMVARSLPVAAEPDLSWLVSLPIAAAVAKIVNGELVLLKDNARFEAMALGQTRRSMLDLALVYDRIVDMVVEGRSTHFEIWRSAGDVDRCELELSIARFGQHTDHFLLSFVDRTAEANHRFNLRREMMNDSLTGFCNRSGFEERIEEAAQSGDSASGQFAILLFDLARFSRINESVGVLAGDELIITVARRLNAKIRSQEILARLSGNEFALFTKLDIGAAGLESIARRIEQAFAEPCRISDLEIKIDCAIAAAVGQIGADDPLDTLRHAQIALKRAKSTKKFEIFSADKLERATQRFSIETDLRRAIDRGDLQLHYQPLIDLETGTLSGFEALARWQHPEFGFISPTDFIPVAEESGLIVPLGRWALSEAANTIARWDAGAGQKLPYKISVNLSAVQIQRDDVAEAVSSALRGAAISGDRLTLELTESAFVEDPVGTRAVLEALKGLDTSLAMDDFGTGYSNLAYLQKLPIDVLKIDRSFISEMDANRDNRAIVSTILSLASALGMKTTAEGIESAEISRELKGLGCTNGQGYYFARPLAADAAYSFLLESIPATS